MLEGFHHLFRFAVEELWVAHMQVSAAAEEFFEVLFRSPAAWEERKEKPARCRRCARGESFGQPLGDAENIPRVFVVILHECLASGDGRFPIVAELARDFRLESKVKDIGRA